MALSGDTGGVVSVTKEIRRELEAVYESLPSGSFGRALDPGAFASAVAKLERSGATRDPMRAQQALSRLTAAERKAWLDAAGEQGAIPEPMNRQQRRADEKLKKRR